MTAHLRTRLRHVTRRLLDGMLGMLVIGIIRFARWLDVDRLADFGAWFVRRLGPLLPEHRVARDNLTAAFPEKSASDIDAILIESWENLGRVGAEFAHIDRLWQVDADAPERGRIEITPETLARFFALRDDGKPALIFAAHLANWELPALAPPAYGLDSTVLFRRPNIPAFDRVIHGIRAANMGEMIPTALDAPVRLAKALQRGAHVGMLVDQFFGRGPEVTFFGRKTKANPLLARLARQIECPIHGARIVRLPGHRFRADLTEEIVPARDETGAIDIAATTQIITTVIEGWIRENPGQWLWQHRRWK
jgi:KDO2-lipid IV(A) lauroyltransferase